MGPCSNTFPPRTFHMLFSGIAVYDFFFFYHNYFCYDDVMKTSFWCKVVNRPEKNLLKYSKTCLYFMNNHVIVTERKKPMQ